MKEQRPDLFVSIGGHNLFLALLCVLYGTQITKVNLKTKEKKVCQLQYKCLMQGSQSRGPYVAETFFLFVRLVSPFYVKMWPLYETEFETPGLIT